MGLGPKFERAVRAAALAVAAGVVMVACASCAGATATSGGAPGVRRSPSAAGEPAQIIVSTAADVTGGDVSSPAALVAHPGPGGISLGEAILATNNRPGASAIRFASALAGGTIYLGSELPALRRDGVSLVGLTAPNGQPSITIGGSRAATRCCGDGLLAVLASDVTIAHLRIAGNADGLLAITAASAGRYPADISPGPKVIRNVRIEQNVFDNAGTRQGSALSIGTNPPYPPKRFPGATGAVISGVTVSGNVFEHFKAGDMIQAVISGNRCLLENLVIDGNVFRDAASAGFPAVEVGAQDTGNRVERT